MRCSPWAGVLAGAVLLAGCSGSGSETDTTASPTGEPSPTEVATASPEPTPTAGEDVPPLAAVPDGDVSLWLDTIGIPVVAAVRTSAPLADLRAVDDDTRRATCRQVAFELDAIAAPELLAGLAITADAETATLLVGDLQAKGELLATCEQGGPDLAARIDEVEHTHAVAIAWLSALREAT